MSEEDDRLGTEITKKWVEITDTVDKINNLCNNRKAKFDSLVSSGFFELQELTKKFVKQIRSIDRWIVNELDKEANLIVESLNKLDALIEALMEFIDVVCEPGFCSRVNKPSERANEDICQDMKTVFSVRRKKIKRLIELAKISRSGKKRGQTVIEPIVTGGGGCMRRQTKTAYKTETKTAYKTETETTQITVLS